MDIVPEKLKRNLRARSQDQLRDLIVEAIESLPFDEAVPVEYVLPYVVKEGQSFYLAYFEKGKYEFELQQLAKVVCYRDKKRCQQEQLKFEETLKYNLKKNRKGKRTKDRNLQDLIGKTIWLESGYGTMKVYTKFPKHLLKELPIEYPSDVRTNVLNFFKQS